MKGHYLFEGRSELGNRDDLPGKEIGDGLGSFVSGGKSPCPAWECVYQDQRYLRCSTVGMWGKLSCKAGPRRAPGLDKWEETDPGAQRWDEKFGKFYKKQWSFLDPQG